MRPRHRDHRRSNPWRTAPRPEGLFGSGEQSAQEKKNCSEGRKAKAECCGRKTSAAGELQFASGAQGAAQRHAWQEALRACLAQGNQHQQKIARRSARRLRSSRASNASSVRNRASHEQAISARHDIQNATRAGAEPDTETMTLPAGGIGIGGGAAFDAADIGESLACQYVFAVGAANDTVQTRKRPVQESRARETTEIADPQAIAIFPVAEAVVRDFILRRGGASCRG